MQQEVKATEEIRLLSEKDLPRAEQIIALAFCKQLGIEDVSQFNAGASHRGRLLMQPDGVFGAFDGGQLVGVIFGAAWGSFGFFGPLVVHPDAWGQGIAQKLLEPMMNFFDRKELTSTGLFTFPSSAKHVHLYQKFGYWPQYLTGVFEKAVVEQVPEASLNCFSSLKGTDRDDCLNQIDDLTDTIYEGLSLRNEIETMDRLNLGETVLLLDTGKVSGFALCHFKPGSEASTGAFYVKFGAVKSGPSSREAFANLLRLCEALAAREGAQKVQLGVNLAREEAYRVTERAGFGTRMLGVAMLRPNKPAFNRPDAFVIDDWR